MPGRSKWPFRTCTAAGNRPRLTQTPGGPTFPRGFFSEMSDESPEQKPPQEHPPDQVAQQHAELKAATHEIQRYLSDDIAPLSAAEFFEELLPGSPEIAARVIAEWVSAQLSRPGENVLASDLVYHSLRKLYLLAEFELLPREPMLRYIQGASRFLVQ